MATTSRDELHRVVEQLPDDRLTAAAELLAALSLQDKRVARWRQSLTPADESEIAESLRRDYTAAEWVTDEEISAWIDAVGDGEPAP